MIELTIRVPNDLAQHIEGIIKSIPDAEIVCSVEDIKTETLRDECAKEAFDELMKLCRPIDIGDDYKAILEEELIRKHGGIDRKYEGTD